MKTVLISFLLTLLLVGCGQEATSRREFNGAGGGMLEGQSAPIGYAQMPCGCSEQSDPVCGQQGVQYTNACVANCYGVNYRMGPCEPGTESFCNQNSGYVCGQPPMPSCPAGKSCSSVMPAPKAFANECIMMQAGASLVHLGVCQ